MYRNALKRMAKGGIVCARVNHIRPFGEDEKSFGSKKQQRGSNELLD
jgi:hypothetical protein